MSGFGTLLNNSQSLYYTNGMNNNQINSNTLLKQRSSQAINNQQNGVGLRNHIQNNQGNHSKPLINSSRIGSMGQTGIIQDQRLNSASRSIIDLNELRNDPVHQFLMSDLSIKDLRQNINQINQANKGQRQNDQQSNIQKANQVTQSTPQQNKNSNNTLHSNTQIYKGLRDFQGKSQSQNMIPLPQNQIKKQQNTNTQLNKNNYICQFQKMKDIFKSYKLIQKPFLTKEVDRDLQFKYIFCETIWQSYIINRKKSQVFAFFDENLYLLSEDL